MPYNIDSSGEDSDEFLSNNNSSRRRRLASMRLRDESPYRQRVTITTLERETSPLNDELISEKISNLRNKTKKMTNFFLDDCDAIKERSRSKDNKTLSQIDDLLKETSVRPRFQIKRSASSRDYPNFSRNHHEVSSVRIDVKNDNEGSVEPEVESRVKDRMRAVEEHLDGILDYELPSVNNFKSIRNILNEINDKMAKHRSLVDRYSGLDLKEVDESCEERITRKYEELVERNPNLGKSREKYESKFDSCQIPGYITGTNVLENEGNAQLRKRIRSLICRTRASDSIKT